MLLNRPLDELEDLYYQVLGGEIDMEEELFCELEATLMEKGRL